MDQSPSDFALQLRSLREARGLSIRLLANAVGVSKVTIWKWERGDNEPRDRLIHPLAKALDVSPNELRPAVLARRKSAKPVLDAEAPPAYLPQEPIALDAKTSAECLPDVIAKAKQMIADASGVGPKSITISIEY